MPIADGNPASFPWILGVTDLGECRIQDAPALEINSGEEGNQVSAWLSAVQPSPFPEPSARCAGVQDVDYGQADVYAVGGLLKWSPTPPHPNLAKIRDIMVHDVTSAPQAPESRRIVVRIDADSAQKIRWGEQEHIDDHRHAYTITVEHLATCINEIAQYSYPAANLPEATTQVLRALAEKAGPVFVPAKPYDLVQWQIRVANVYKQAAGRTASRDTLGHHSATWNASFQPDRTLLIYPSVPDTGTPSNVLITLDGISPENPDWQYPEPAPVRKFSVNDGVVIQSGYDEDVEVFQDESLTSAAWSTTYRVIDGDPAAAELTIVALPGEYLQDDRYVIKTKLTDPNSQLPTDSYFEVRQRHLDPPK
jgi:hypothetical protein